MLLCFESVFAAVSGVVFGMDAVTLRLVAGASLIFGGTLIIELLPAGGHDEPPAAPAPTDGAGATYADAAHRAPASDFGHNPRRDG